jgi:hypothetical protein
MDATTFDTEATRYLRAVELYRSLEVNVEWRSEAAEVEAPTPAQELQRDPRCERCAGPLVRYAEMLNAAKIGGHANPAISG